MARVSSRSGLFAAPHSMTYLTRPMTPQLIPQEPLGMQQCHHCFCGHWPRRNHPLPYTQGQLIVIIGVENLPSEQVLPCCEPEVCSLVRPVHYFNKTLEHQPFQGFFLFPQNSMILFIRTLILAHPFDMKTSCQITPTFHTSQLLLSLAQTTKDKCLCTLN